MIIYLKESLGMTPTLAAFLNGDPPLGLIYIMPILSGTLADKYGYKKSLALALVLLTLGYLLTGNIGRLQLIFGNMQGSLSAGNIVLAVMGISLIGIGGSIVKPASPRPFRRPPGRAPCSASPSFT